MDLKTILVIAHLFGMVVGMGAAFTGDNIFFSGLKRRNFSSDTIRFLKLSGKLVWLGLLIMFIAGISLFFLNVDRYIDSSKFLLKMIVVTVIALNGLVFHLKHLKFFERFAGQNIGDTEFQKRKLLIFASGGISSVSWISALILGSLRSIPYTLSQGVLIYLGLLIVAVVSAGLISKFYK
jgi:hypothetical protein